MAKLSETMDGQETRKRLLEAAGELFAEKGFHAVSVREICKRADANVAAVNYHFGGKQQLLEETIMHAFTYMDRVAPLALEGLTLRQQLRGFIENKLRCFLDPKFPRWHLELIHGEQKAVSLELHQRIAALLKERITRLRRIIGALTGLPAEDERVLLHAMSVMGQILFMGHPGPKNVKLPKSEICKAKNIEMLIEHIYQFSLAGMKLKDKD